MKKKQSYCPPILIAAIFVFLNPVILYAESGSVRVLTIDDFIKTAVSKDTKFEEILIDELSLKYRKGLALPAGDIVLAVKSQYEVYGNGYFRSIQNSAVGCPRHGQFGANSADFPAHCEKRFRKSDPPSGQNNRRGN